MTQIKIDYDNYTVIDYLPLLKSFAKKGFITLHKQTGTKITSLYSNKKFTCHYVDDGESLFEVNGYWFGIKYLPGCFCPYVVRYNLKN